MRVNFQNNVSLLEKKEVKKPVETNINNMTKPSGKMSFMDIPATAFAGNIVRTKDTGQTSLEQIASIMDFFQPTGKFNLRKAELPPQTEAQLFVNPQDPLVTKPELMTFMTAKPLKKGPEGERVKIIDYGNKLAEPNSRGNFIYAEDTPQFDQVNAFAIVKKTFDMYQDLLGRQINWAFPYSKQLTVYPHAGTMMNAYYSRQERSIKLFQFMRPDTMKIVKTCQASDIVSHETGHATLDGIKPKFMENYGFGVMGFHEAFADTTAMLLGLQNDGLINKMLDMTKGDLRKENIIASLAEEFGDAIHKNDHNPSTDNMQYLRNAINFFVQKPFKDMPYYDRKNDDTVLGLESHSYSRLLLGANYDVLVGLYNKFKTGDTFDEQKMALMKARDIFAKDFARSLDFSPAGEISFKDMALAMIKADIIDYKGQNRDVIQKVFLERKIITDSDITAVDKEMETLPKISLPETVKSAAEVVPFVKENQLQFHVPEDVDLVPLEAYINDKGEKHIVMTYDNYVLMDDRFGPYKGQTVNILGSLHLVFDKDNQLICKTVKKISPKVKENVLYSLELLIKDRMSHQEPKAPPKEPQGSDETESQISPSPNPIPRDDEGDLQISTLAVPELLSVKSELGGFTQIVRQPTIIDTVDHTKRGAKALGEYFSKLQEHMAK